MEGAEEDMAGFHRSLLSGNWTLSDLVIEDFFDYTPSIALGAIALVLYALAAAAVGYQTWRSKWRYMHTVT
jgi:hypothetical protein